MSADAPRGGCLTVFLSLQLVATAAAALLILFDSGSFGPAHPVVAPNARLLLAGAASVSFFATLALWRLRRAGLYCLIVSTAASACLNHLYLGASVPQVVLVGIIRFIILGLLLWRVWPQMD